MRRKQDKPGKQQHAEDAEFDIRTALQELVPPAEVLAKRHQQEKKFSENQHRTAAEHASFAPTSSPVRILAAMIKTAAQNCTTRLPRKPACEEHVTVTEEMSNDLFANRQTFFLDVTSR